MQRSSVTVLTIKVRFTSHTVRYVAAWYAKQAMHRSLSGVKTNLLLVIVALVVVLWRLALSSSSSASVTALR